MNKRAITSFHGEHAFLSNFCLCDVELDGVTYPSTEHAFQAAKTLSITERDRIRLAPTPGIAKRAGRTVSLRHDWESLKIDVMRGLLRQKFAQPRFADALRRTADFELVEGNTWNDTFWGVCKGVGENHLGKLLMEVRAELATVAP